MVVYVENLNLKPPQKTIKTATSVFNNVLQYNFSTQNLTVFLCTSNEHTDTKVKNTIRFTIAQKENEALRCKYN